MLTYFKKNTYFYAFFHNEVAEGSHTLLNMSQFAADTYLVRIYTENSTARKRVNVKR